MAKMLLTGVDGNLGGEAARVLLDIVPHDQLIFCGYNPASLEPYAAMGVETHVTNFNDPDGLADAPAVIDIFSEQLSYAPMKNGHPGRYFMVLDTASGTRPFGPGGRYALLFGKQKKLKTDLQYRMEFARMIGTSAVFCQDFQSMLEEKHQPSEEADRIVQLIRELRIFGCQGLFVISKSDIGEISLPSGTLIPMNQSVTISQGAEEELKSVIEQMRMQGKTLLISTHIIDSVDMLWDRTLIMQNGQIKANITKHQLDETGKSLEDLFFEVTEGVDNSAMTHQDAGVDYDKVPEARRGLFGGGRK